MLKKKRGVAGSAKSRSPLDQPGTAPFLLQPQGASKMALANTIMEGQLPMNSFTDEIEKHRVQNQFAGSVFPQQTEVMQQDSNRPFAIDLLLGPQPAKKLLDGFIDLGKQSFERQLQYEITKIERMQMTSTEFKNFLEHDFVFSNVSPAIDMLGTMLGQESVSPPTPDEEAVIAGRIRNLDPSLLTDQRAQIKILKSPNLWAVLYEEYSKYLAYVNAAYKFVQMLVQMLRKTAKDYNLPIPPWFDNPPGPPGGGGGGPAPPPPPAPPADPTAPPSVQRPDTDDLADPTLETEAAPQTGTAMPESTVMPPTPPVAPPPTVMPPTTPTTGMGLHYHPRQGVGYPPPPPNMPPSTPSPIQDQRVLPQYTPFYMAVIQYMLVPAAALGSAAYAAYRVLNPRQIPPVGGLMDNAVEGGAQQSVIALFSYLIVNFTQQFVESNLAGYLVENIRDNDPFFIRSRWSEWTRMLMEQVLAYSTQNQPLFPDPTEIPLSNLKPRQVAEALLSYFDGFARNREQDVIDALRRYLGEQQPQAQAQPQPQPQGVNEIARANMPFVRAARAYVARLSNASPSQYKRTDLMAFSIVEEIMTFIKRRGLAPRFSDGFNLDSAIDAMEPGNTSARLQALNGFILNYGEQVEQLYGAEITAFLDLLVRVAQHFNRDREP
jgi:hypothetical protein